MTGCTAAAITDGTSNTAAFAESWRGHEVGSTLPAITDPTIILVYSGNLDNLAPPVCTVVARYTTYRYRGQEYYRAFGPTAFYNHTLPPNTLLYDCGTAADTTALDNFRGDWRPGAITRGANAGDGGRVGSFFQELDQSSDMECSR